MPRPVRSHSMAVSKSDVGPYYTKNDDNRRANQNRIDMTQVNKLKATSNDSFHEAPPQRI